MKEHLMWLTRNTRKNFVLLFFLLTSISVIVLFSPMSSAEDDSKNDSKTQEEVKEFPHDLYEKGNKVEDEKITPKSSGGKEIDINVHINLNEKSEEENNKSDVKEEEGGKEKKEYPDPPKDVAKNPENLLWYYLERWINDDYKAMYGSLSDSAKKKYSFKKFYSLYQRERDVNGGLESAKILGEFKKRGPYYEVQLELNYRNENIKPIKVKAVLQYTADGYRIEDCGLIPIDYTNL